MSKQPEHTQPVSVIGEGATLGVIGAGVMGQTLLRGLLSGKLIAHDRVWAGDKNPATCEAASEALGVAVESDFHARVPGADLILLCVKPNDAPVVLATLRNAGLRRETLLISILAGVGTDRLESLLGTENPVVRAMPNTPAHGRRGDDCGLPWALRLQDRPASRAGDLRSGGPVHAGRRDPFQRRHRA